MGLTMGRSYPTRQPAAEPETAKSSRSGAESLDPNLPVPIGYDRSKVALDKGS